MNAHLTPFEDSTFDRVLSYALLEHLHIRFLATSEIARVLNPEESYVGTVSQGGPVHNSYFHNTAWGLTSLVATVA
jgi:ubiquinone/menaquinone biosynthesis C-methylase UbiE